MRRQKSAGVIVLVFQDYWDIFCYNRIVIQIIIILLACCWLGNIRPNKINKQQKQINKNYDSGAKGLSLGPQHVTRFTSQGPGQTPLPSELLSFCVAQIHQCAGNIPQRSDESGTDLTTFMRPLIGWDCRGHMSTINSLSCSENTFIQSALVTE